MGKKQDMVSIEVPVAWAKLYSEKILELSDSAIPVGEACRKALNARNEKREYSQGIADEMVASHFLTVDNARKHVKANLRMIAHAFARNLTVSDTAKRLANLWCPCTLNGIDENGYAEYLLEE